MVYCVHLVFLCLRTWPVSSQFIVFCVFLKVLRILDHEILPYVLNVVGIECCGIRTICILLRSVVDPEGSITFSRIRIRNSRFWIRIRLKIRNWTLTLIKYPKSWQFDTLNH
jgi:hypothetical protein